MEIYAELQNWDKVQELQTLFTRRYATDKARNIQALCMGGAAAYARGRGDEAAQLMSKVISEFNSLKSSDASARFYAAQAQHTLGEIYSKKMRESAIRAGAYENDLKAKTNLLKSAVDAYLKVLDYRIVDWALRAAYSLGQGFEDFGTGVYMSPRKAARSPSEQLDREEDAMASLSAAYAKAQQQYLQVLSIGRKQEVNNRWVGEANGRMVAMAARYMDYQVKAMAQIPQVLRVDAGTPEKAIAGKLQQIGRIAPYHEQGAKYFMAFLDIAQEYELDPKTADSLGSNMLRSMRSLGSHYLDAAELARAAPFPSGFQPMERFFYQVKLLQEGIPKLEEKAIDFFQQGLEFAGKYNLKKDPVVRQPSVLFGPGRVHSGQVPGPAVAGSPDQAAHSARGRTGTAQDFPGEVGNGGLPAPGPGLGKVPPPGRKGSGRNHSGGMGRNGLCQAVPDRTRQMEPHHGRGYVHGRVHGQGVERPRDPARGRLARQGQYGVEEGAQGPCPQGGISPRRSRSCRASCGAAKKAWDPRWTPPPPITSLGNRCGRKRPSPFLPTSRAWKCRWWRNRNGAILVDKDTVLSHKALSGPWNKGIIKDVWPQIANKMTEGEHFFRIVAQNQKPAEGFGVWARLRIKYRLSGNGGPIFPWNQGTPTTQYLKSLMEREIPIPNFSGRGLK